MKRRIKWKILFPILFCIFLFSNCEKTDTTSPIDSDATYNIWVLNEGLWNMNNASITGYNTSDNSSVADLYSTMNSGQGLGDIANDILLYGSKAYVALSTSSHIDILDKKCVSIKRLLLATNSMPRRIASANGKIYVCCFDGSIVKIDTAYLQIEATIKAGRNPDGICVANNKLYVSNSGGLDFPNYDSTVSVIDLNTFTEIKKINLRINPRHIKADKYNNVYVVSSGNYSDISSCLQKINTNTDILEQTFDIAMTGFDIYNDYIYFYSGGDFGSGNIAYQIFDILQGNIINNNFIADDIAPQNPYSINVNPLNGDVFITTHGNYTSTGDVYCFDKNGKKMFEFETGFLPNKVVVFGN